MTKRMQSDRVSAAEGPIVDEMPAEAEIAVTPAPHKCSLDNLICQTQGHYGRAFEPPKLAPMLVEDVAMQEDYARSVDGVRVARVQTVSCGHIQSHDFTLATGIVGPATRIVIRCQCSYHEGAMQSARILSLAGKPIQGANAPTIQMPAKVTVYGKCPECGTVTTVRLDTKPAILTALVTNCGTCCALRQMKLVEMPTEALLN